MVWLETINNYGAKTLNITARVESRTLHFGKCRYPNYRTVCQMGKFPRVSQPNRVALMCRAQRKWSMSPSCLTSFNIDAASLVGIFLTVCAPPWTLKDRPFRKTSNPSIHFLLLTQIDRYISPNHCLDGVRSNPG